MDLQPNKLNAFYSAFLVFGYSTHVCMYSNFIKWQATNGGSMWQRKARNGAIKHGTGWTVGFAMNVLSNVA